MRFKWTSVKYIEGEKPWVTYAHSQIYQKNKCVNLVCTGSPGSGKSWALLSYFHMIDRDFNVERCYFKAKDLIRDFGSNRELKGRPFLFDEAGIDANSLKWQDEINRGLNAFFQTARHRNYIFGMTVPYMSMVSRGVRTLMNVHWKATGWQKGKTIVQPLILEYNGDLDKFYRKRLIVRKDNRTIFCNETHMPKPPRKLMLEYEKKKKEFTADLFNKIADAIELREKKDKIAGSGLLQLTQVQEEILTELKAGKSPLKIAEERGITQGIVYKYMGTIKKRGIIFHKKLVRVGEPPVYTVIDPRDHTSENSK